MRAIQAPIIAVTIYSQTARVTRQARLRLKKGENVLVIKKLPDALEVNSIRTSGKSKGVVIRSVDVLPEAPTQTTTEKLAEFEAQLAALEIEDQVCNDESEVLKARFEFLETFREKCSERFASAIAEDTLSLDNVTAVTHYIVQQMTEAYARRREIEKQRTELKQSMSRLRKSMRRANRQPAVLGYEARLVIEAEAACQFTLELNYAVRAARWRPCYDVRLMDNDEIEVIYFASIAQRTGEDWSKVQLALSTEHPTMNMGVPTLSPWYVDEGAALAFTEESTQVNRVNAKNLFDWVSSTGTFAQFAEATPEEEILGDSQEWLVETEIIDEMDELESENAEAKEESLYDLSAEAPPLVAVKYQLEQPLTIPSDGEPYKAVIAVLPLPAKMDYLTVPKLSAEAYLRATITNESKLVMLDGEAALFQAGDFVNKTHLNTLSPDDTFQVIFGAVDTIKVQRELLARELCKPVFEFNRCLLYTYRIQITNLREVQVNITLADQLPLVKSDKIRVRMKSASPEPTEHSPLNLLEWKLLLQPGEKQEITFTFTVEHPRDIRVHGLEA